MDKGAETNKQSRKKTAKVVLIVLVSLVILFFIIKVAIFIFSGGMYTWYIRIPEGIYRCYERGITLISERIEKEEYTKYNIIEIEIDRESENRISSSILYNIMTVIAYDTNEEKVTGSFGGAITVNDDGSLDILIDYASDSEKWGIAEGMTLHFIKISDTID